MLLSALVGVSLLANAATLPAEASSGSYLRDLDLDGKYRIFVAGDSNSSESGSAALGRTNWVAWIQREDLLPKVRALLNERVEASENVVWMNGSVPGWACVGTFWSLNNSSVASDMAANNQADAILVTAGTNDLQSFNATPQTVVDCYRTMQVAAARVGMAFFVATTPPVFPPFPNADSWNQTIGELNALIRATFDPRITIDFDSGFTADMFPAIGNGRHINDDGEKLRARRVTDTLTAAQL